MSEKFRSNHEDLALVRNTLRVRDPGNVTVAVGSVALVAELHKLGIESPVGCDDVDVLCPQSFFDRLLVEGPFLDNINKFQVRWPKGRLRERGATNKSIDIFPRASTELAFTACYSMSDLWYPIDYDSCQPDVTVASGIRCLRIGRMLEWMTAVGREKDTEAVEAVLPLAEESEAITSDQAAGIREQLGVTYLARKKHPERYYARIDM